MRLLLIFLLTLTSLLLPQNKKYTNLFNKYIPAPIKNNEEGLKQINRNLEQICLLHPSIIYYYLHHLDLRFNYNITKPDSNFLKSLNSQINKMKKSRNNFAMNQKIKIEEKKY